MLIEVDEYDEALALAYEAGWTDGLPVVPTTAARVAFLDASAGGWMIDRLLTFKRVFGPHLVALEECKVY